MSPMGKCLMGICRHGYMSHGYMSPNRANLVGFGLVRAVSHDWLGSQIINCIILSLNPNRLYFGILSLNFGATNLPHSYFEPSYPQVFG